MWSGRVAAIQARRARRSVHNSGSSGATETWRSRIGSDGVQKVEGVARYDLAGAIVTTDAVRKEREKGRTSVAFFR